MKKRLLLLVVMTILCSMMIVGCTKETDWDNEGADDIILEIPENYLQETSSVNTNGDTNNQKNDEKDATEIYNEYMPSTDQVGPNGEIINSYFNQFDVAAYSNSPSIIVNDNMPFFDLTNAGMQPTDQSWEYYNQLDDLGRTQIARANLSPETMPAEGEERGEIGHIKPAGWHTSNYRETDVQIDGNYLYNRCHLIGWQLSGENDNALNLITGTRYLNVDGMLPYENMIANYIRETGNNVLYRVTPCYNGDNLVCDGILLEAMSVQEPDTFAFCVYCYNVQPGVYIDYATGENWPASDLENDNIATETPESNIDTAEYAVNPNNGKIHIVGDCAATDENSDSYMSNPIYFNTYEEAENYSMQIAPDQNKRQCGNCW